MFGCKTNEMFVTKCMMKKSPVYFVSICFSAGVLVFGYAIRIAEAPLSKKFDDMDHSDFIICCWEAILTMTTGNFYFFSKIFKKNFSIKNFSIKKY